MTPIDEVRALLTAIEKGHTVRGGQWTASVLDDTSVLPPKDLPVMFVVEDRYENSHALVRGSVGVFGDELHARFTAAARQAVPALLAELATARAAAFREAAEVALLTYADTDAGARMRDVIAAKLREMAAEAGGAQLTVYRAAYEHEDIPLGTYAAAEPAREHSEDAVRQEYPNGTPLHFGWHPEEPVPYGEEGVERLYVSCGGEEADTGCTVTPLTVDFAYDPGAEG